MTFLQRLDREWKTGWAFAAPGFAMLAIVMGFPLVYAVLMALSSQTLLHPALLPFKGREVKVALGFKTPPQKICKVATRPAAFA